MPTITKHWLQELPTFSKALFYSCIAYSVVLTSLRFVLQFSFLTNLCVSYAFRLFIYTYPHIALVTNDKKEVDLEQTLSLNEDVLPMWIPVVLAVKTWLYHLLMIFFPFITMGSFFPVNNFSITTFMHYWLRFSYLVDYEKSYFGTPKMFANLIAQMLYYSLVNGVYYYAVARPLSPLNFTFFILFLISLEDPYEELFGSMIKQWHLPYIAMIIPALLPVYLTPPAYAFNVYEAFYGIGVAVLYRFLFISLPIIFNATPRLSPIWLQNLCMNRNWGGHVRYFAQESRTSGQAEQE